MCDFLKVKVEREYWGEDLEGREKGKKGDFIHPHPHQVFNMLHNNRTKKDRSTHPLHANKVGILSVFNRCMHGHVMCIVVMVWTNFSLCIVVMVFFLCVHVY